MPVSCIDINTIYYLELFITDINGDPKTGLTPTYTIYKSIDDSILETDNLNDIGNGIYKASYIFSEVGQYYIIYTVSDIFSDEVESVIVQNEFAKEDTLLRALGLSDENKRILDAVHDANGNLTSATIKLYPTAVDFENDTNVLATYEYNATYNESGLMITMGIKRTS